MHFQSFTEQDGHFRVVVGFDHSGIYLHDPWDRSASAGMFGASEPPLVADNITQPRLVRYDHAHFCALWNYSEINGNATYSPYFGAVMIPWKV